MENTIGQTFSRDEVCETVVPAYVGLIKQCDDQMGRLFKYHENSGKTDLGNSNFTNFDVYYWK